MFTSGQRAALGLAYHFALGVLVALVPYAIRSRFYFHDDMQHQFLPAFYHIGRLLRQGEFPVLTLTSWNGGNLLGEYQYALLNPVSLALYAVLPSISDYHLASFLLAAVHYGVLTAGCYLLARSYGIERHWASLAAFAVAGNNFLAYWAASNWMPLFVSFAWAVWAWAFLLRAHRSRLDWALAVLFCFLTVASGFPQTTLFVGIAALMAAWPLWRGGALAQAAAAPAALTAAVLLSAVQIFSLLSLGLVSVRDQGVYNTNFLVPNLHDVIALSSPFHFGFIFIYGGYLLSEIPMFFAAWFIMPLLPLINWRKVEWRRPEITALGAAAVLLLIATQGPEYLYVLRLPFRWLPYLHVVVVLLFCLIASRASFIVTPRRLLGAALVVLFLWISSWQTAPAHWPQHLAGAVVLLVGIGLFAGVARRRHIARVGVLAGIAVLLLAGTRVLVKGNGNTSDWRVSRFAPDLEMPVSASPPSAYGVHLGGSGFVQGVGRSPEYQTGFMTLQSGLPMVNGYSAIGHKPLLDLLCMNWAGATCPEAAHRLFETDPVTGMRVVDLFRIDRIMAAKGPHLDTLRPYLDPSWRLERDGRLGQLFVRELPQNLPGSLAWLPGGLRVDEAGSATTDRESLRLNGATSGPTRLVFARLWWPGYRADLDGVRVPVEAHRGIFVSVDLPPGASGTLTLRFRPPPHRIGLAATAAGALATLGGVVFFGRLFRRSGRGARGPAAGRLAT